MVGISIIGGIMHNVGQIICAAFVVRTNGVFTYLPLLMIAGVVSGKWYAYRNSGITCYSQSKTVYTQIVYYKQM